MTDMEPHSGRHVVTAEPTGAEIEAAAQALRAADGALDVAAVMHTYDSDAHTVLTAVLPLVEARLRQQWDAARVGARRDLVEDAASRVAARLRPGYSTEQRKRGAAGRAPVPWEERYEVVDVAAGTADDDTMVVFTAEDGVKSIRALTWREVTFEVLGEALPLLAPEDVPQVEARLREQIAGEIAEIVDEDGPDTSFWHGTLAAEMVARGATHRNGRALVDQWFDRRGR